MSNQKQKILLVYPSFSTFVERDFNILSKHFEVQKYHFKSGKGYQVFISLWKQLFFLLFNAYRFNHLIIWFADSHTFLPVLFAKLFKVNDHVIIGGFDAGGIASLSYGIVYANRSRKYFNFISLKYATTLLPVDKSLISSVNEYAGEKAISTGIRSIVQKSKAEIIEFPTGYDHHFWQLDPTILRGDSIACVASIPDRKTWILKGGDLLLDVARKTSQYDIHFYGIHPGFQIELKKEVIPDNFHIHGLVAENDLPAIYSAHKVYAQLSLSEGLPNALCEAMLCECIPIGSKVNGIPEAIGDCGFVLEKKKLDQVLELIKLAMSMPSSAGQKARKRIINKYSAESREARFLKILQ